MGTSNKMKLLSTLITLFSHFCFVYSDQTQNLSDVISTKTQATSVLNTKQSRLFGANNLNTIRSKWNNICKFDSVAALEEFKDELEETNLPENEVDNFEKCIFWCKTRDFVKDFVDQAYEEQREERSETSALFQPACPQCFTKIPKSSGITFNNAYFQSLVC